MGGELILPVTPVSLTGETWERLRQGVYGLPADRKGALVAAATVDADGRPRADLLLVQRLRDRWYVMGSVGYADGRPSAAVAVAMSW